MANEQNVGNKSDVVIVGCKLPTGYLAELIPPPREAREGSVTRPAPAGVRIKFNGANTVPSDSLIVVNPRVLGYGRTAVPREFWEKWLAANKDREIVKNGFIFAESREADFRAHVKEGLPEKTGLEGLTPEGNDARMKKIQIPGHPETKIETDAEHLKRLQDQVDRAAA